MKAEGKSAHDIAWALTDKLVTDAEKVFADVYAETKGNDGFVSFELDPKTFRRFRKPNEL